MGDGGLGLGDGGGAAAHGVVGVADGADGGGAGAGAGAGAVAVTLLQPEPVSDEEGWRKDMQHLRRQSQRLDTQASKTLRFQTEQANERRAQEAYERARYLFYY